MSQHTRKSYIKRVDAATAGDGETKKAGNGELRCERRISMAGGTVKRSLVLLSALSPHTPAKIARRHPPTICHHHQVRSPPPGSVQCYSSSIV